MFILLKFLSLYYFINPYLQSTREEPLITEEELNRLHGEMPELE